jgi:two-component system alkaline phosphatase synthesis response regulator PhoP
MKPKVLVVDDEADFRQLMEYNLAQQDFEVFTAADGLQALNEARRILPDVILLDLMLPDLDGFTVCQLLRAQPSTSDVAVIIVSALSGQTVSAQGLSLGVAGCLRKPVDLRSLADCVRGAFLRQQEDLATRMTARCHSGEDSSAMARSGGDSRAKSHLDRRRKTA